MTKEDFIKSRIELETKAHKLKLQLEKELEPINTNLKKLEQEYIDYLLSQNPHIKIGAQFTCGKDKVWVYEILLDHWTVDLKVKLNKVKKDGTNGNASANTYGTSITNLKENI